MKQHQKQHEYPEVAFTMKRIISTIVILIPLLTFGQNKPIPINISLFNESTALPFTKFITLPVHPGIQIGTELNYRMKENSRLFQTANICYFYHNYLAQGIGLNTEIGYEYRLESGLAFSGLFGIGYLHTFATTEEFTLSDGKYVKKADKGNERFYPSLSIDLGYYLKKTDDSPKLFVRYQSWAEYPYSPDFIPVMTHISLHIGAKFFIFKRTKTND